MEIPDNCYMDNSECVEPAKMSELDKYREELHLTRKQNEELLHQNKLLSQRINDLNQKLDILRYVLKIY